MFIIRCLNPVTGYWTGSRWDRRRKFAQRFATPEDAQAVCTEKFSWLRSAIREGISIIAE